MFSVVQNLALVAVGILCCLSLIWRWPGWIAFVTISAAALLDCLQIGTSGVTLGINLYVDDAAVAILLLAGLLVLLRYHRGLPGDAIPCAVLLALVALNFGRGVGAFGLKAAGNSARNLAEFTVPAAAVMLLQPVFQLDARRLARWLGWAGYALSAIAILRWAGVLSMPAQLETSFRDVVRALPADYAFMVGLALIAVVYLQFADRSTPWGWLTAAVFSVLTILLQHRSVWVATAAGVGWLSVRTARSSVLFWLALAAVGAGAGSVAALAFPQIVEKVELLVAANVQEAQGEKSTWAWRVQSYQEATDRLLTSGTTDMLIGPPAGWAANSNASFASTHIHSRYIDTLAFYGILGFAVLLLWFGVIARRVLRPVRSAPGRHARDHAGAPLLEALLLSEIVYLVPYFGGILQGTVLGLVWVAANQSHFSIATKRTMSTRYVLRRRSEAATRTYARPTEA